MKDLSKYFEIPWKENGRSREGCDCWGLVRLFYLEEWGIEIDDFSAAYETHLDREKIKKIAETEKKKWIRIEGAPNVGDILEIPISKNDFHVGVIAIPGMLLHIEDGAFAQLIPLKSIRIKNRIKGIWRHHGFA